MADRAVVVRKYVDNVLRRHPWVDAGMLKKRTGSEQVGAPVRLVDEDGVFLAWGLWASDNRFPIRLVAFAAEDPIGPDWFAQRALEAADRRAALPSLNADTYRVVFGEADGLPGLVADIHAGLLVIALECSALRLYVPAIASALCERLDAATSILRTDGGIEILSGAAPEGPVVVTEAPLLFEADILSGQKTGWFCDQRENRRTLARYAAGRSVLDVFSYSGGFAVASLVGGAESALLVDASEPALQLAQRNLQLNGVAARAQILRSDGFEALADLDSEGRRFGLVVIDPPKFLGPHQDKASAERAYRKLQAMAMKLVERGGLLATFSCSGAMERARFDGLIAEAAGRRNCRIIERFCQPADHPISTTFRKSEYLTGLLLQLD